MASSALVHSSFHFLFRKEIDKSMSIPDEIIALEESSSSATAYDELHKRWQHGARSREEALHLMFLAWDLLMEPARLTGRDPETRNENLMAVFNDAHASVLPDGDLSTDAEALYAVGLMANLAPWLLGPLEVWEARSAAYRRRYRDVLGGPVTPDVFCSARGSYALYFRGQAAVGGGY
jgi:hypothetical protein